MNNYVVDAFADLDVRPRLVSENANASPSTFIEFAGLGAVSEVVCHQQP